MSRGYGSAKPYRFGRLDLICAVGIRSGGPGARVYPGGGGWLPETGETAADGSGVDGVDAPRVPVLGEDDHVVLLHAAKRMVVVVRSMASWSGHWRRPELGVAPASSGRGSRRRCAAGKIRIKA